MKKLIIVNLLFIIVIQAYTQGNLTPNAFGYAQYATTPVNYYNGLPSINLPIANINDDGCTIPISLSYHASGIKIEQQSGRVGLGWHLNVSGAITKVTIGEEDKECHYDVSDGTSIYSYSQSGNPIWGDYMTDYYTPTPFNIGLFSDTWNDCPRSTSEDDVKIIEGMLQGKNMPDIYYFNFYGHSGQFIIDYETENIRLLMKTEDILFKPTGGYFNTTSWEAVTMDGTIFTFGSIETKNTTGLSSNYTTSKTFYLTSVKFPNSKLANYSYTQGNTVSSIYSCNMITVREALSPGYEIQKDETVKTKQIYNPKRLTSITTDNIYVNFSYSSRDDIQHEFKLDEIYVEDRNTNEKKYYDFAYDYFTESNVGGTYLTSLEEQDYTTDELTKRLKLDSFGERNSPKYVFTYNTTPIPHKTSYARDYWGYFNGQENTTLLPNADSLTEFEGDFGDSPPHFSGLISQANRMANESFMQAGILTKIENPLGGTTEYDYEAHTFDNLHYESIGDNWIEPGISKGGGLRIKTITTRDNDGGQIVSEQNFQYDTPTGSYGKLMSRLYFIVSYTNSSGYSCWGLSSSSNVSLSADAQGAYVGYDKVIVYSYGEGNMGKSEYNYKNYTNKYIDYLGGFDMPTTSIPVFPNGQNGLVKNVKHYNAQNTIKSETIYDYTVDSTFKSIGIIGVPSYTEYSYLLYYPSPTWKIYLTNVTSKTYDDDANESTSISEYTYNNVGLMTKIREINAQPGKDQVTDILYAYDYYILYGHPYSYTVDEYMYNDHCYNYIYEKKVTLGNEVLSKSEVAYTYKTINNKKVYLPETITNTEGTNETEVTNSYDNSAKLIQTVNNKTEITTAFIWAYDNVKLVAQVAGATYSQATGVSGYGLSSSETNATTIRTEIEKIRTGLPKALVSTITYDSFSRKESETDANGNTIFYKYDSHGRMFRIVDQDGNVLKEMHYNVVQQ